MMRVIGRILLAVAMGLGVLVFYGFVNTVLTLLLNTSTYGTWVIHIGSAVAACILCVLLMLALGWGRLGGFGFAWPTDFQPVRVCLLGLAVGVATSVLGRIAAMEENMTAAEFSFLQVVVFIWICASIWEEVLTRGLVQGFLSSLSQHGFSVANIRFSLPMVVSALFFGAMHLVLLTTGMGLPSVLFIVVFACVVGLIAALYRERTGSLLPAIMVHMAANIGGTVADELLAGL